jgi:hypothetical protein
MSIVGKPVLIDHLDPKAGAKLVKLIADDNARAVRAKKKKRKKAKKKG